MSLQPVRETKPVKTVKWTFDKLAELALGQLVLSKWGYIVSMLTAVIVAIVGWAKGLTYERGVLLGLCVLLVCSLVVLILGLARNAWRPQTTSQEEDIPKPEPLNHENCDRTINNLESRLRLLQRNDEKQGIQISAGRQQIQQLETKLKSFEWLREIANNQKNRPLDYIRANDCWIVDSELLEEPLFIDVRCLFYSSLVFSIDAIAVQGALRFANRRFTDNCTITEKWKKPLAIGEADGVIVRQPLTRNEAATILSRSNTFYFDQLSFDLELNAPEIKDRITVSPECSIDNKELRTKYPQLRFNVITANFDPIANIHDWAKSGIDTEVTLKLELENPRKTDVFIETVRLAVTVDNQNRVVSAESGDIFEIAFLDEKRIMQGSKAVKNLGRVPLIIVGHGKVQGHFEFKVDGMSGSQAKDSPMSLVLTDRFGETHVLNFTPTPKHE
jgi:hypothetical protein